MRNSPSKDLSFGQGALVAGAVLIWVAVGFMLSRRGLGFIGQAGELGASSFGSSLAIGLGLLIGALKGRYVLSKAALRNLERIRRLRAPFRPWQVFAPRFYFLIALMMGGGFGVLRPLAASGGIGLKLSIGGIYLGIGGALVISALAYIWPDRFAREPAWRPEPEREQGLQAPALGLVLANLGTPDSPEPKDVGEFLREFLWDRRVIEVPRLIWFFILNGYIVPFRKYRSAELYRRVFTAEGSPLLSIGKAQAQALQAALGEDVVVRLGMRYGRPSIDGAMSELKALGCERVLIVPAYAQYSNTTTASIIDASSDAARAWRHVPSLRFMPAFPDAPEFIEALARRVEECRAGYEFEHLVISYHGIPVKYCQAGDPYAAHCVRTTRALARRLDLGRGSYSHSYQSQFGSDQWLGPATDVLLKELAAKGIKKIAVICPAFLVDCLETIDEIGHESAKAFKEAGGEELRLIPCVNDHPAWIAGLASLCRRELGGWLAADSSSEAAKVTMESELSHAGSRD